MGFGKGKGFTTKKVTLDVTYRFKPPSPTVQAPLTAPTYTVVVT